MKATTTRSRRALSSKIAKIAWIIPVALWTWLPTGTASISWAGDRPWLAATILDQGDTLQRQPEGGPAAQPLAQPFGIEVGPDGNYYVAEAGHHRIVRIDAATGRAAVIAGTGDAGYSGDGGPATKACLNEPYEVRFDRKGNLFIVEMKNHVVRRIDAKSGVITTVAGTGVAGFGGDGGPATAAQLRRPHSIALDDRGNLYIADIGNQRIRRVELERGTIESIAGNGKAALPQDGGPTRGRPVAGPRALACADGALWVALREGHSVWRIDLETDTWHHVAGTGEAGYSGDGGPARKARFNGPKGIAVGPHGMVYVADTENHVIRRIDVAAGRVTTIGGAGDGIGRAEGPADDARFDRPHGIAVDTAGRLIVGDTLRHRVVMLVNELRIGIIGLDTSHVIAFTKMLNQKNPSPAMIGCRVVAAYPPGSPDIESSVSRRAGYTKQLRETWNVEIVDTIPELLDKVDAVLLESNDGRPHLKQALPVIRRKMPLFIDKPVAGDLTDAVAIFQLADDHGCPLFTSSSLRFARATQAVRNGKIGRVWACQTYSPSPKEKTHPDLYWYGIHGVESLFTVLGSGCLDVTRFASDNHDLVVGRWKDGRSGTFLGLRTPIKRGYGGTAFGEKGVAPVGMYDGYGGLLQEIVTFFRTKKPPVSPRESLEIYAFMTAADVSRSQGGKRVALSDVLQQAREAARKRIRALPH